MSIMDKIPFSTRIIDSSQSVRINPYRSDPSSALSGGRRSETTT
jgi:energy-coupling factor transporter ATP-binding protein EcfA2